MNGAPSLPNQPPPEDIGRDAIFLGLPGEIRTAFFAGLSFPSAVFGAVDPFPDLLREAA
ncbi:MAG: hypothetical protein D084_Lepto4C00124G0002 [Leptospirillum sp. Group IV 'UBA BS']|nr:MAG: hypothetical protein D084_Lepto4C00124G0002 [Leptospirillum sp. Group IV 'UBA BS']